MFIGIGSRIRTLREQKGISQDSFSKYLGIPIKDLIRIENGELYPPLETIPVIADYFETTTDALLCMDQFDHEDKIRAYTEKFQSLISEKKLPEAIETVREALTHFPRNFKLKYLLLYSLYLSCDRPASTKHYSGEILALCDDILMNCTDDQIRLESKRILCLHYYEDQHDAEKARSIAMGLPGRIICREDMMPLISEGDDKLKAVQENILSYTELLCSAIESCASLDPTLTAKGKADFYELSRKLRNEIFPESDFFGSFEAIMNTDKQLAILYMSFGEEDKALDLLDEAARCAAAGDALNKAQYVSPLVNRLIYSRSDNGSKKRDSRTLKDIFMNDIICHRAFEPLRYNQKIKDICDICVSR
ncbi:MAG: helix-turn-helix transcriptional regulator [Firmicutes bacterium]|nr:helix-turn-helix transcriptional regulator [Bacillota bacterium]